jgi:hypothetical protein
MNRFKKIQFGIMKRLYGLAESFCDSRASYHERKMLDYGKPFCPFWNSLDKSILWGDRASNLRIKINQLESI